MTKMQDISRSGFRELKPEEVEAVSGGGQNEIIVNGSRPTFHPDAAGSIRDFAGRIGHFNNGGRTSLTNFYGLFEPDFLYAGDYTDTDDEADNFVDTDNDGEPDTIVVTAPADPPVSVISTPFGPFTFPQLPFLPYGYGLGHGWNPETEPEQDHCGEGSSGGGSENEKAQTAGEAALRAFDIVRGMSQSGYGPPNPMLSPSGRDWTQVEFGGAIAQNSDGSYGILNGDIFTNDHRTMVVIPIPNADLNRVVGIWHNHPGSSVSQANIVTASYPSDGTVPGSPNDWDSLQILKDSIAPNDASFDPSIFITGPDGVTREFKLSEREYYENLTQDQRENGVGLEGSEVSSPCSSG